MAQTEYGIWYSIWIREIRTICIRQYNLYQCGNFEPLIFISIQTNLYNWGSGEWGPKRFRNHLSTQITIFCMLVLHERRARSEYNTTCPSNFTVDLYTNVELSGCEATPCYLQRGTTATIKIDFHSNTQRGQGFRYVSKWIRSFRQCVSIVRGTNEVLILNFGKQIFVTNKIE